MTLRTLLFTVLLVALFTLPSDGSCAPAAESEHQTAYTFVLVHGASGGGWDWRTMDELLTSRGHNVYRPTLTGLALPATAIIYVSEDAGPADLDAHPSWRNAGKRGWTRLTLVSDHNAQRSHPGELADMLEAAPVR